MKQRSFWYFAVTWIYRIHVVSRISKHHQPWLAVRMPGTPLRAATGLYGFGDPPFSETGFIVEFPTLHLFLPLGLSSHFETGRQLWLSDCSPCLHKCYVMVSTTGGSLSSRGEDRGDHNFRREWMPGQMWPISESCAKMYVYSEVAMHMIQTDGTFSYVPMIFPSY